MIARRPRLWWVFALVSALLIVVLSWASVAVYRLEERNAVARAERQRLETIRQALWRLDSQLAPIIASEAREIGADSPASPYAVGRFVTDSAGRIEATDERTRLTAERLLGTPVAAMSAEPTAEKLAESSIMDDAAPERAIAGTEQPQLDFEARQQIANLARNYEDPAALRTPTSQRSKQAAGVRSDTAADPAADAAPEQERTYARSSQSTDFGDSAAEVAAESDPPSAAESFMLEQGSAMNRAGDGSEAASATQQPIEVAWVAGDSGEDLLLYRRSPGTPDAEPGGIEGVRLDWPALRERLLASVGDLLPAPALMPDTAGGSGALIRRGVVYRLATIPALLDPGAALAVDPSRMTPAFWALLVTWIVTLAALIAVAMVLHATLRLSDRRARFVGAVTHELRTPLTTFRLYAQMLAGGMVSEDARREYLATLERESIRLGEIVENVLEYARLTRRRPGDARPPGEVTITPGELLARVRPVLSRRAEQSGMDLIVTSGLAKDQPGDLADADLRRVTCDPRSVERILMNLVENACKYAHPEDRSALDDEDTRIHLDVSLDDRTLEMLVADHGPGVPARERERVFGEFRRGPGATAGSRPGLGLGLALSRGLAREMGGDLRLVRRRGHGAEFLLSIPLDQPG